MNPLMKLFIKFVFSNRLKRYEIIMIIIQTILIALISNKIANSFGYCYDSHFIYTISNIIQYIFSGYFVAIIFFIFIAYCVFWWIVATLPYMISHFWDEYTYNFNKHLELLVDFRILKKNNEKFEKSENFDFYSEIVKDITGESKIKRTANNVISILISLMFCLAIYNLVGFWVKIMFIILSLFFLANVTVTTVLIRQTNYYCHTIYGLVEPPKAINKIPRKTKNKKADSKPA